MPKTKASSLNITLSVISPAPVIRLATLRRPIMLPIALKKAMTQYRRHPAPQERLFDIGLHQSYRLESPG